MRFSTASVITALAGTAAAGAAKIHTLTTFSAPAGPTASDPANVYAAQATALTLSPTSHVKGKAFDRYVSIWFENTDFDLAKADPNFAFFAEKGITLENFVAVTHPSEPNYMSVVGGDYWGNDNDDFHQVPENVSSVADLLEDKGISWGHYQEDMPYSGYQGYDWVNQKTGANDYVRKHNPEIFYNSVANKEKRLAVIKNTTLFFEDLENDTLPQWMFITPNMTSDAHDSSITVAGEWLRNFLEPLLTNEKFMNNTLVVISFDENETYTIQNRIFTVLLGDAVPESLQGTCDSTFYNHYSELATVEANWNLHTLGRYDVGANVFKFVADQTGDEVREWNGTVALEDMYFNTSYPGIFNEDTGYGPIPIPNTKLMVNGRTVLPSICSKYGGMQNNTHYKNAVEIPDGQYPPTSY